MKHILSIPLLLLIAVQTIHLPALSLWLEYHKDYVAEELCKNRYEPQLMCSGRCYVQEVTAEAIGQQSEEDRAPLIKESNRLSFSPFLPVASELALYFPVHQNCLTVWATPGYERLLQSGIFHPPRA